MVSVELLNLGEPETDEWSAGTGGEETSLWIVECAPTVGRCKREGSLSQTLVAGRRYGRLRWDGCYSPQPLRFIALRRPLIREEFRTAAGRHVCRAFWAQIGIIIGPPCMGPCLQYGRQESWIEPSLSMSEVMPLARSVRWTVPTVWLQPRCSQGWKGVVAMRWIAGLNPNSSRE